MPGTNKIGKRMVDSLKAGTTRFVAWDGYPPIFNGVHP